MIEASVDSAHAPDGDRSPGIASDSRAEGDAPSLHWLGAGLPVFIGEIGRGTERTPVRLGGREDLDSQFPPGGIGNEICRRVVMDFFAAGGEACHVFNSPGFDSIADEHAAAEFLGEDGGPGYRSGLFSLGDLEDGGTMVVPGDLVPVLQRVFVEYVARRHRLALVLEATSRCPHPETLLADIASNLGDDGFPEDPHQRIVWHQLMSTGNDEDTSPSLGALVAWSCRPEFNARIQRPTAMVDDLKTIGGAFHTLRAWRFWAGLRRSLDLGTRWVLFEIQDAFLAGRLDREVRAFLYRLYTGGLFGRRTPDHAFRVSCTRSTIDSPRGPTGSLALEVGVTLPTGGESGHVNMRVQSIYQ